MSHPAAPEPPPTRTIHDLRIRLLRLQHLERHSADARHEVRLVAAVHRARTDLRCVLLGDSPRVVETFAVHANLATELLDGDDFVRIRALRDEQRRWHALQLRAVGDRLRVVPRRCSDEAGLVMLR